MCHHMIEVWHFNKALGPGASFDKACHSVQSLLAYPSNVCGGMRT
jgi:hypothetical protein